MAVARALLVPQNTSLGFDVESPYAPGEPPRATRIFTVLLNMVLIMTATCYLVSRWPSLQSARKMPFVQWLNIVLYVDSLLFTAAQMVVRYAYGLNYDRGACNAAVYFCLSFYLSSKLMIYWYFTERSYLVWSDRSQTRRQNKLYIFNMTVINGGYVVIIIFTFIYKIDKFSEGFCVIGLEKKASIPLVAYEMAINIYLTGLFLWPVRKIYSFKRTQGMSTQLRQMTIRCLVGTFITCISTGVNITVLTVLNGEQAWLCLMLCSLDILICVSALHWVTSYGINSRSSTSHFAEPRPSIPSASPGSCTETSRSTGHFAGMSVHESSTPSTWNDPVVTTCIAHPEKSDYGPQSPKGISVHMEHSQKVELASTGRGDRLDRLYKAEGYRREKADRTDNAGGSPSEVEFSLAGDAEVWTPRVAQCSTMTEAHLRELGLLPREGQGVKSG